MNLFEFGFGLSYTSFDYSDPVLTKSKISDDETVLLSVNVRNAGLREGREIVQMYIRDDYSQITRPVKELKGFKKINLKPGEEIPVEFLVEPEMLAYYNRDMEWIVEKGTFTIMVGSSSRQSDLKSVKLEVN